MGSCLKRRTINILSREKMNDKGLFLKRMGTLIEEGYSIKDSLLFLGKIMQGKGQVWVTEIQTGLLTGETFHKELENVGFAEKTCSQIYLAAQYGNYGQTIRLCGEQLLEKNKKQAKLKSLATYPVLLIVFLLIMLLVLRILVFPHMETLMVSVGGSQNIYANSIVTFVYYSPQIIAGTFLLLFFLILFLNYRMRSKTYLEQMEMYLKLPFLNRYLKDYYSHFFFYEWAQLFNNGCSFQEIVSIMRGEDSSKLLKETGEQLSDVMLSGLPIHQAVQTLPFFHDEGIQVITHGESLGKLGIEMAIYADYCEEQLNNRIEKLMDRLQPIIFCFVGLMIVAIYAALMLPMFNIMEGL